MVITDLLCKGFSGFCIGIACDRFEEAFGILFERIVKFPHFLLSTLPDFNINIFEPRSIIVRQATKASQTDRGG